MSSSMGDRMARQLAARRNVGEGVQQPDLPPDVPVVHDRFDAGYNASRSAEQVQDGESPYSIDIEVTRRNGLKRCAGVTLVEALVRAPAHMAVHASLDQTSEVILIAPPFLGVMFEGSVVWTDHGLPSGGNWVTLNAPDRFLFTNQIEAMFARQPNSAVIERLPAAVPMAASLSSFAGRNVSLGAMIGGNYEPLGVAWNAANGQYNDYESEGAGFEYLIGENLEGDYGVAARAMNFDFIAFLLRKSIWIGRRTQDLYRPIDFSLREAGGGCIAEPTARSTHRGVIYLSDDGVRLFDGNKSVLISEPINPHLLPLDEENITSYSAMFNPFKKRYTLFTPTETWIFDIEKSAWYRRSLQAHRGVMFAEQTAQPAWEDLVGTWGAQTETWADFRRVEGRIAREFYLQGQNLGVEDPASILNFAVPLRPEWHSRRSEGVAFDGLVTTKTFEVKWRGSGRIALGVPDENGEFQEVLQHQLPNTISTQTRRFRRLRTGLGFGTQIKIISGDPEIEKIRHVVMPRGQRIGSY